jgi:hypothetical protein
MPPPSKANPRQIPASTSSPVRGRELGSCAAVAEPEPVEEVVTAIVAWVFADVVVEGVGAAFMVGGGAFDVEVVGQESGSTYWVSPADPEQPLPDAARAIPAPSSGMPTAPRHAATSPSLLIGPVLQAREPVGSISAWE